MSPLWGLHKPDLTFVLQSADRLRHLVGCTAELKVKVNNKKESGADEPRGNAHNHSSYSERADTSTSPWVTALAQETVYALEGAEMYGATTGMIGVGTIVSRMAVLDSRRHSRTLALEVGPEFHAYLQLSGFNEEIPLEELMRRLKEFGGDLGAFDLRGADGDVDETSLQRLWSFLLAAATGLADTDDEVLSTIPDDGQIPEFESQVLSASDTHLLLGAASLRKELGQAADRAELERIE